MKPTDLPSDRLKFSILQRLQCAGVQIRIWRALKVSGEIPSGIEVLNKYGGFTVWWPETTITTFILNLCSLFDTGSDCVTIRSYQRFLIAQSIDTAQIEHSIKRAEELISPLREVRHNYYAHRLVGGMMTDLIQAHALTHNELLRIYEATKDAVQNLLSLDDKSEFVEFDPVEDLKRLIFDLSTFDNFK